LKKEEIIKILESLSFSVIPSERSESRNLSTGLSTYSVNSHSREIPRQARDDALIIIPPSFRQFDVTIPEDIVEEVARIYGYHNLPSRLMTGEIPITDKPKDFEFEEEIKHTLKYWGYTEVYNYSFISGGLIKKTGLKTADHLKVANPLTEEIEYMRISLIPSMLETIVKNQPYKENLQLFELAKVYIPHKAIKTPVEELPKEVSILTITNQKSFYELKGIVEALTRELGIQNVILSPDVIGAKNPQHVTENDGDPSSANWRTQDDALRHFWHPQQIISLNKNGENLGYLGKIHPYLSNSFQIKNDLYIGVLNIELLAKTANPSKKYTPIPQYPPVLEDLTFILPQKSQVGFIIDEIYKTSPLIKTVQILDSFKNNITFRITYQSETKNLSGEDVKKIRQEILQKLENKFKIKLKQ
ncbi:hypothetical protein HZB96_05030, partial [Candidatus Gottesmanbacteria bacterium]|nr:hypothetical protein [Candidatus Gottesmanbacteria bacterium]